MPINTKKINVKNKFKTQDNATNKKFEEIKSKNEESVKKMVEEYESSSDEDELDERNILG